MNILQVTGLYTSKSIINRRWQIISIAKENGISPSQVCLSWSVQRGVPAVPKSVQEDHMRQNLALKRLPNEHFQALQNLWMERGPVRFLDPSKHLGFDIFDEEGDQPVTNGAPWD